MKTTIKGDGIKVERDMNNMITVSITKGGEALVWWGPVILGVPGDALNIGGPGMTVTLEGDLVQG